MGTKDLRKANTKIVCTLGPATTNADMIDALIDAGMNVARVNFSHGRREDHGVAVRLLRERAQAKGVEIGILVDLQGPKIRANTFPGGCITLEPGTRVSIRAGTEPGADGLITTTFAPLVTDAQVGEPILFDDGLLDVVVEQKLEGELVCRVVHGGLLKDKKGINLPGTRLKVPAMTEKDILDLEFALTLDIDFVALSFVRCAEDIEELRRRIQSAGSTVSIVAKIEKPEALENLDGILAVTDLVMVARGDLGVELGNQRVPGVQKNVIKRCLEMGVPVITATQMLESMITNPRPTRAEASDVANAIFDGTDAVMLSGETAVGKYPIETVRMMREIVLDAEEQRSFYNFDDWNILDSSSSRMGMSIGKSARVLSREMRAVAMVCYSHTGNAAIRLTTQRPQVPVYMFSPNRWAVRRLCLVRGAWGILLERTPSADEVFVLMEKALLAAGLIHHGEPVVYTAGIPTLANATTNTVHVRVTGAG